MSECGSLIDQAYMKEHYLETYLEDAVGEYLVYGKKGNNGHAMKPSEFFHEYFRSMQVGGHVVFREFSFISTTPYNRLCVLRAIMQIYRPLLCKEKWYDARSCHSLLILVWPDFPIQVVHDAFTSCDDGEKNEENCLSFTDFLKAFKASFCTGEFNYESDLIKTQIEKEIGEFSNSSSQTLKSSGNLRERRFLEDDEVSGSRLTSRMLDIHFLLNSIFSSIDDKSSGEKSEVSSFESKDISDFEKNKEKIEYKSKVKSKCPSVEKSEDKLKGKIFKKSIKIFEDERNEKSDEHVADKLDKKSAKQKFDNETEYKGTSNENFADESEGAEISADDLVGADNFADNLKDEKLIEKAEEIDEKKPDKNFEKTLEDESEKFQDEGKDKYKEIFIDEEKSNRKSKEKLEDKFEDKGKMASKEKFEERKASVDKEKQKSDKNFEEKLIEKFENKDNHISTENFIIGRRQSDIFNIMSEDKLKQNNKETTEKGEYNIEYESKGISIKKLSITSKDIHKAKKKFEDKSDYNNRGKANARSEEKLAANLEGKGSGYFENISKEKSVKKKSKDRGIHKTRRQI